MPADSQAHPPRFRLWLRRQNQADGAFALRFEVMEGKGILRVARPGVLIDPPARQVGVEERLSSSQLRTTRFILVWDGGRARQGHLLSRLEELQIDRVELDRWHELEVVVEGGFRYVVLPVSVPVAEARPAKQKSRRPSLSELRQALDSLTVQTEDSEDVDSALASLTGPPPPAPRAIEEVAEAPLPARSSMGPVAVPASHEATRPTRRPMRELAEAKTQWTVAPPAPAPAPPAPAPVPPAPAPPPPAPPPEDEDEALALGEADDSVENAESLEMSDPALPADFGAAVSIEPPRIEPRRSLPEPAMPVPEDEEDEASVPSRTGVGVPVGAAAFYASMTNADEDEEAMFSIDVPGRRQSTEHVTVRKGASDDGVVFAREVLPPIRPVLPVLDGVELPTDPGVGGEEPTVGPEPPTRPLQVEMAPEVIAPAGEDDGPFHRAPVTLVRHLRRKVDEQRGRIAELEARVHALEAELRGPIIR